VKINFTKNNHVYKKTVYLEGRGKSVMMNHKSSLSWPKVKISQFAWRLRQIDTGRRSRQVIANWRSRRVSRVKC